MVLELDRVPYLLVLPFDRMRGDFLSYVECLADGLEAGCADVGVGRGQIGGEPTSVAFEVHVLRVLALRVAVDDEPAVGVGGRVAIDLFEQSGQRVVYEDMPAMLHLRVPDGLADDRGKAAFAGRIEVAAHVVIQALREGLHHAVGDELLPLVAGRMVGPRA